MFCENSSWDLLCKEAVLNSIEERTTEGYTLESILEDLDYANISKETITEIYTDTKKKMELYN